MLAGRGPRLSLRVMAAEVFPHLERVSLAPGAWRERNCAKEPSRLRSFNVV